MEVKKLQEQVRSLKSEVMSLKDEAHTMPTTLDDLVAVETIEEFDSMEEKLQSKEQRKIKVIINLNSMGIQVQLDFV